MRDWLASRNYPRRSLVHMKRQSLIMLISRFQLTEKIHKRMIKLDLSNPEYIDITKKGRLLNRDEIKGMAEMKRDPQPHVKKHKARSYDDLFPKEVRPLIKVSKEMSDSWILNKPMGKVMRSVIEEG